MTITPPNYKISIVLNAQKNVDQYNDILSIMKKVNQSKTHHLGLQPSGKMV